MIRYPLAAALLSIAITLIWIAVARKMSVPAAIAAGAVSGLLLLFWFARKERRLLDANLHKRIVLLYGLFMGLAWLAVTAPALFAARYNAEGIVAMLLYVGSYPLFMAFTITRKGVEQLVDRNAKD